MLRQSGPILVHDHNVSPQQFILEYEGIPGDVILQFRAEKLKGEAKESSKIVRITAQVNPEDVKKLKLLVVNAVKLRSMTWTSAVKIDFIHNKIIDLILFSALVNFRI